MAIYSKLLLSAGGGIVSATQQAEQVKNTATILIGLGGTGIDCLRTIKTQVYSRLKPDDEEAVVPTYEHIRFLGVDTAERSKGDAEEEQDNLKAGDLMSLDDTECFSISNQDVKKALSNEMALAMREELNWLRWNEIDKPNLSKAGAGGIRQVGRFMMMDKSQAFMARLETEINRAKRSLTSPTVNVHIFSGLSGGTGSGCFLDVCYMVRQLANAVGGVTVFGYFFLPDVNLSCIPLSQTRVHEYVPKNGYAAMQELDYCMQLQFNGGGFVQHYQGGKRIEWKEPPVDMCHLVCATNAAGDVIPNAYDYAMNVTAEYVMDFLTYSNQKFGLEEQLSNFQMKVSTANEQKTLGSNLAYCVIGASCASIPLREINTYLASELFSKFAGICANVPSKQDVERLAISSLARSAQDMSGIYDSLRRELMEGTDTTYAPYYDDWKFVRDFGNSQMVTHYTNQTAAKLNVVEKNGKSMSSVDNQNSLLGRVRAKLAEAIVDIQRGPMFAYGMISAAKSHNFLNIIDGLIEENSAKWNQEAAQSMLRNDDYERAKRDFENRKNRALFDNDQKRFNDYEYYLGLFEQHRLELGIYQKFDEMLKLLRKQMEDVTASYYIKLSRVVDTLVNTFKENRDVLASEKVKMSAGSFSIPLMTVEELKGPLDDKVAELNVPGLLDSFMKLFLNNESVWITEDENKITKMVTEFFVKTAFEGFADRTITSFLSDKYNTDNVEVLTNMIYRDWITRLTAMAEPLFYRNDGIWNKSQTDELAYISVPAGSAPVKAAVARLCGETGKWEMKESALTDRIYIMACACTLPLCSYNDCGKYENAYFESTPPAGRHYYEGKPVEGMAFNDWRELPSLTPQSRLVMSTAPSEIKRITTRAMELYEEADRYGIFNHHNQICKPDEGGIQRLKELIERSRGVAGRITKAADIPEAEGILRELEAAKTIPMVVTGYAMKDDGKISMKKDVQKDHFVDSPAYHIIVREILDTMKTLDGDAKAVMQELQNKIQKIGAGSRAINDFCDAVFTGVFSIEGRVVVYRQNNYGVVTETVLSKRDETFAYNAIPVYQAFLSYQSILDDEVRAAVKKSVNDRYNGDEAVLRANGEKLVAELADNKVAAWTMAAEGFPERDEIIAFITKMKQQFSIFCMDNGIA